MTTPEKTCPECGNSFLCGSNSAGPACWCGSMPRIMPVEPTTSCRCPNCLAKAIATAIERKLNRLSHSEALRLAAREATNAPPVEHIDYVMEGPAMVFTRWFLLKRGFCCGSNCRNCPFPSA
ncbi:MAG: DUF5522 domain-containing protein [Verrucomicrobiales bacterium]